MRAGWRQYGAWPCLLGLCCISLWARAGLPRRPDPDEEATLGGSLAWSSRVRDYELRESPLWPARANTAESLLAGEWAAESWWASGYVNLQHQWLGSEGQDASSYKLGQLYWHPMLGENTQLQVGKFTLDLDPSYSTHPAGFFQAASSPFDDFLPDVGTPMVTLTHWFDEQWSGHLVAASEGTSPLYSGQAQWGGVVQFEQEGWLLTGLLQKYQDSPTGVGGTFVYESEDPWSWHGSWASRDRGAEKLNLMLGGMWQGETQSVMLEYGYDSSSLTYLQLWQQVSGRDGKWLSRLPVSEERRDTEHQSLFAQYNWENEARQIQIAAMVAQDRSAISQLRHTWLTTENFRWWLEGQRMFGEPRTTYGLLPWCWQLQAGFSWQFI